MRRETGKRAGKLAIAATVAGFAATLFVAPHAEAYCASNKPTSGTVSYRLERYWSGALAHQTNCDVVVPTEQVVDWVIYDVVF